MSLKDSGTKRKPFFRVLTVSLLVLLLAALLCSSFSALAETNDGSVAKNEESVTQTADTFPSGYPNLSPDATLGERLLYGLKITGIGMAVVFLVLIIIMAILYVFKAVALSRSKKPAPAASAPAASPAVQAVSGTDEETVVAVATAAIAASRGASACAFKVISITKIQ